MKKSIAQHYLQTGILGAYETACVEDEVKLDGKYAPCFDDSNIYIDETNAVIRRTMEVDSRRFRVCSVFSTKAVHTPTDKLIDLINSDLEKR